MYERIGTWTIITILSCYIVYLHTNKYNEEFIDDNLTTIENAVSRQQEELISHQQHIVKHSEEFDIHKQEIIRTQTQNIILQNRLDDLQHRIAIASKGGAFIVPPINAKDIINDKDNRWY